MNHNRTFAGNRLRGLALQLERGQLDHEFAESGVPVAERRELIVRRIRQLADKSEDISGDV